MKTPTERAQIIGICEIISQKLYGKSPNPEAPENQNNDFRKGFLAASAAIDEAGRDERWLTAWGEYGNISKEWQDWKRGWWSGMYRQER